MMSGPPIGGVVSSITTPLRDDRLDVESLVRHVEFQIERGVHALFALGTIGEGPLLSMAERREVCERVIKAAAKRVPVIVHCGAADTRQSIQLARHARDAGADAIAVVAPYFYSYGRAAVYGHFLAVAGTVPDVDVFVYDNPARVGYSLDIGMVVDLDSQIPNFRGVKDTGDSIGRVMEYVARSSLEVLVGNNSIILPALTIGARGVVSSLANAVPELIVSLTSAVHRGDLGEALELQKIIVRLTGCLDGFPQIAAVKQLCALRGIDAGSSRAPQRLLTREERVTLEQRLEAVPELGQYLVD